MNALPARPVSSVPNSARQTPHTVLLRYRSALTVSTGCAVSLPAAILPANVCT
ncbi:MAG: hypothetical protein R3F53_00215 [Gammaproteobacteria bacterium]